MISDSCLQQGCLNCTANICQGCKVGYYFNQYLKQCNACSENCDKCSSENKCTSCAGGYYIGSKG